MFINGAECQFHAVCFRYIKIVRDSDPDEYQHEFDYKIDTFMLIVISDSDPPPSIMQNYFAVKIVDKIE